MSQPLSVPSDLQRRQERAIEAFLEARGYAYAGDVELVPDCTKPLTAQSVHVQMPTLRFSYYDPSDRRRRQRTEISAIGLEIPTA